MVEPLDVLFVKEEDTISGELLRDLLVEYVQLTPEGKIYFLPEFSKLKNKQKIVIMLLAKKVLSIKLQLPEEISPKEIQQSTGLPVGTTNPTLRQLAAERLVVVQNGCYRIPSWAIV